jgi:hypothetical protein
VEGVEYRDCIGQLVADRVVCWPIPPDPLPEPEVRLSPHPALHEVLPVGQPTSGVVACRSVTGWGSAAGTST